MPQSANKLINSLLAVLNGRQREVIVGRYALDKSAKPLTLAALGEKYKITRERIRQIEVSALKVLGAEILKTAAWSGLILRGKKCLKDAGGVLESGAFLKSMQAAVPGLNLNHMLLVLEATGTFHFRPGDKNFHPFFYLDKQSLRDVTAFLEQWVAFLRGKKGEALAGKYRGFLEEFVKRKGVKSAWAENYLGLSRKVQRSPYGDVGLTEWAEIAPKTIRDRVYLILKKKREPLHFRVIAQAVNQMFTNHRSASAPTVHNELIKDGRFVLVGRGIYALREHGYEPGTAREVIRRVLRKNGPLRPREVILAVQKERFFKPNTVLVNLQNKAHFARRADGTYQIREA